MLIICPYTVLVRNGVNRRLKRQLAFTKTRYMSMEMSVEELEDGVHLDEAASNRLFDLIKEKAQEYFESL